MCEPVLDVTWRHRLSVTWIVIDFNSDDVQVFHREMCSIIVVVSVIVMTIAIFVNIIAVSIGIVIVTVVVIVVRRPSGCHRHCRCCHRQASRLGTPPALPRSAGPCLQILPGFQAFFCYQILAS